MWMMNQGYTYWDYISHKNQKDQTLLDFYFTQHPHSSREEWQNIIKNGLISVDGKVTTDPSTLLQKGQKLAYFRLPWIEPEVPKNIDCIYQDEDVVVFNKPSGLPVLPRALYYQNTLFHIAKKMLNLQLKPVHRLGRGTSGAILFGKNAKAAQHLSLAFKNHGIIKVYLALLSGIPTDSKFTITKPIGLVPYAACCLTKKLWAASEDGKPAVSHFEVIKVNKQNATTLVKVIIETGRPHQIRIHAAYAGYPLEGDPLYMVGGTPKVSTSSNRAPLPGDTGYLLHSWQIVFLQPTTNAETKVTCYPPFTLDPEKF